MEQGKLRPSVTLYSLDWSLQNLVWLITSVTPTQTPILGEFGWVGNSPQIGEFTSAVTFGELKSGIKFWTGSSLMAISTHVHEKWSNTVQIVAKLAKKFRFCMKLDMEN